MSHVALILLTLASSLSAPWKTHAGASPIDVSGSIATAVAAALPGDVLQLQPRAYVEAHVEISRAGTAERPITLRGAGVAQSVLNGRITFRPGAAFWILEDFAVDMTGAPANDALRANPRVHHLTLRRVHVRNGRMNGIRLEDDVANVLIEDCDIGNFVNPSIDAHGIGLQATTEVVVRGCALHNNSGDGIQSHTSDKPGGGRWARNVLIEGNHIFNNGENGIDVKSTHGISLRNNTLTGYRAAGGGEGIAIEVQYDAQDVEITGNRISDAAMGIELTRGRKDGQDYPALPTRVRIAGNLIHDLIFDAFTNAGNGVAIVLRGCADVDIFNNTVLRAPTAGLYMGRGNNGEFVQRLRVVNNVFDGADNDLDYNSDIDALPALSFSNNHFVNARVRDRPLSDWISPLRDAQASSGEPAIDATFAPATGSPLIDTGINVGLPYAGAAPDRGWSELVGVDLPTPTPVPTLTLDPRLTLRVHMPLVRR